MIQCADTRQMSTEKLENAPIPPAKKKNKNNLKTNNAKT